MKKILISLILFLYICNCFAQKFDESERLKKGDITLLENYISDLALAKMDNCELRILRNMIYARHGHSFESADLKKIFSKYTWYKPHRKINESEFSKNEKDLLERIVVFETRNEDIQSFTFRKEITGLWHASPVMPDTWCDRFLIYPGNRIEFLISNFIEDAEVIEYLGNYEIKGNVLTFFVNRQVKAKETTTLKTPIVFKFPIFPIEEVVFGDGKLIRQMIKIGSYEYFLYDDNTETMGVWSRKG